MLRWQQMALNIDRYQTVDSKGNTLDFMLNARHNAKAAKRFFRKALNNPHTSEQRVITVDKNEAYPSAIDELKEGEILSVPTEIRQSNI